MPRRRSRGTHRDQLALIQDDSSFTDQPEADRLSTRTRQVRKRPSVTEPEPDQRLSFRQIDLEELVARRTELEAPLEDKRSRLKKAKELQDEKAFTLRESEATVLARHRLIQKLGREVEAEEEELKRLNRRISSRKPPRGVAGDMRKRTERRKE